MKTYDRTSLKRLVHQEAVSGVQRRQNAQPTALQPPEVEPGPTLPWRDFAAAYEAAARTTGRRNETDGLLRISRCPRFSVRRVYRCGTERPLSKGWCASPYCPSCAQVRSADAVRSLRKAWGADPLLWVTIPVAPVGDKLDLPARGAVAAVRAAWAKVTARVAQLTGRPRLHAMPRVVVNPDGLSLFLRAGAPTPDLLEAVRIECRRIGLRDVEVRAVSSDVAARGFAAALTLEADRFLKAVTADLERLATPDWDKRFPGDASRDVALRACAFRWVEQVRRRRKEARRHLVLGARDALPAPIHSAPTAKGNCPAHGANCAGEAIYLRDLADHGRLVAQAGSDALSDAPRAQEVGKLIEQAATPKRRTA
jgi:hypothetical protein